MNAHINTMRNWGSTQESVLRQWSSPESSIIDWELDCRKKPSKIKRSVVHEPHYLDWDTGIYPVKSLIDRVTSLENKIEELAGGREIEIREISFAQAKKEIRQYFKHHHGEDITAADLEDELGIDFELASEVCESLEKEGKIREA